jgi:enterochelin esterase family protein
MKSLSTIFILLFSVSSPNAQTFADFLSRINATPQNQRTAMVDSIMNAVPGIPFVEQDSLAHFIYRGTASSVSVPGDANGWNPAMFPMTTIAGTRFWYRTEIFETDARLEYKLVLNGSNWILDPENPQRALGGFGPNSELRMPQYDPPPETMFYPGIAHGTLRDTTLYSINLANSREIRVYLPPGYESTDARYPMILFHDGLEYISLADADNVIDYLISRNRIEPLIGVFVPPVNRSPEYAGNQKDKFAKFIVEELIPWVDSRYRTRADRAHRAVMGASNGGNISLWLALNHSDIFANVAAQSSNIEAPISNGFSNSPKLSLKFYVDLGTYDIPQLIPLVRNFIPILESKGYTYSYAEYHEGHSWGFWKAHIDDALEMFFPAKSTGVKGGRGQPNGFRLMHNYPNPFNPATNIKYITDRDANVAVSIYNILGQKLQTISQRVAAGEHTVQWNGENELGVRQPSGVYVYQILVDGTISESRRMMLLRN